MDTPEPQVIKPHSSDQTTPPAPNETSQPITPVPDTAPQTPWQFNGQNSSDQQPEDTPRPESISHGTAISWTAPEFVAHNKSTSWYLRLAVGGIIVAALIFWLTSDKITTAAIIVVTGFFGYFAGRQPRQIEYILDEHGLSIGKHDYDYDSFKSFAVINDHGVSCIEFIPLRRFMPTISVYYDNKDEHKITSILLDRLPMVEKTNDFVDRAMRRINF